MRCPPHIAVDHEIAGIAREILIDDPVHVFQEASP